MAQLMDGISASRCIASDLIFLFFSPVRLHESMRELEQLRSKPELTVATLLALVHAHKQHKTPGRFFEIIQDNLLFCSCYFRSRSNLRI